MSVSSVLVEHSGIFVEYWNDCTFYQAINPSHPKGLLVFWIHRHSLVVKWSDFRAMFRSVRFYNRMGLMLRDFFLTCSSSVSEL